MYIHAYPSDELYHYGIKGQQWGIRRYENEDGTLTPEGKERYSNPRKITALDAAANIVSLGAHGSIQRQEAKRAKKQLAGERTAPKTGIGLTARGGKRAVNTIGHSVAIAIMTHIAAKKINEVASVASPNVAKGLKISAGIIKTFGAVNIAATTAYNFHAQTRDTIDYTNNRFI